MPETFWMELAADLRGVLPVGANLLVAVVTGLSVAWFTALVAHKKELQRLRRRWDEERRQRVAEYERERLQAAVDGLESGTRTCIELATEYVMASARAGTQPDLLDALPSLQVKVLGKVLVGNGIALMLGDPDLCQAYDEFDSCMHDALTLRPIPSAEAAAGILHPLQEKGGAVFAACHRLAVDHYAKTMSADQGVFLGLRRI